MNLLILVIEDEPDVSVRQPSRRDLDAGWLSMGFAQSAPAALH